MGNNQVGSLQVSWVFQDFHIKLTVGASITTPIITASKEQFTFTQRGRIVWLWGIIAVSAGILVFQDYTSG
jgi:hypothetical protein